MILIRFSYEAISGSGQTKPGSETLPTIAATPSSLVMVQGVLEKNCVFFKNCVENFEELLLQRRTGCSRLEIINTILWNIL